MVSFGPINTQGYRMSESTGNISSNFIRQIIDKDLEEGKWVKIDGWAGANDAKQEILTSVTRFNAAPDKPYF